MRQEEENPTPASKERDQKGTKAKISRYAAFLFLFVVFVISASGMVKKEKKFSEDENRLLTQKPDITWQGIADGRYTKQYENYKADQFIGRDFWAGVKTKIDWLGGSREENGVFLCSDGYLMEDIVQPDTDSLQENLKAMKKFQKNHEDVQMNMLLVPDAAAVMQEKLPALAVAADQRKMMNEVKNTLHGSYKWLDAAAPLANHKDAAIYYKTDHHWTTKGAYYVFQGTASDLGIEKGRRVEMEPYAVTDTFNGTLSAKSGYERSAKEVIQIYLPKEDRTEILVNYAEEKKKTASMYDSGKLEEKDKYGVFFGGNHPLVQIRTTSGSRERLLVVKDSYANCFVPFLTYYYREIVMVDPRYYYGDIEELMNEHKITQVLFLYNANTFFRDNNISGVLESDQTE